jgi:hypothetical protein
MRESGPAKIIGSCSRSRIILAKTAVREENYHQFPKERCFSSQTRNAERRSLKFFALQGLRRARRFPAVGVFMAWFPHTHRAERVPWMAEMKKSGTIFAARLQSLYGLPAKA